MDDHTEQAGTPAQRQIALDGDRALWLTEVAKMRQLLATDGPDDAAMRVFATLVQLDHVILARWALAALVQAADTRHLATMEQVAATLKLSYVSAPQCQPGVICIEHGTAYVVTTLAHAGMLRTAETTEDMG